jgi:hypothetical protein
MRAHFQITGVHVGPRLLRIGPVGTPPGWFTSRLRKISICSTACRVALTVTAIQRWCLMVRGALVKGYSFLLTILICVALVPIWSQASGGLHRLKSLYKGKVLLWREEVTCGSCTLAGFEITDIEPTAKGVEIVGDRNRRPTAHSPGVLEVLLGRNRFEIKRGGLASCHGRK